MGKNTGKCHPRDMERLIHFHESVVQYDKFVDNIPLEHESGITDDPNDPGFLKYCLRASLLRKYWAPSDELAIDKVIESMRTFLDGSHPTDTKRNDDLNAISTNFTHLYRNKKEESEGEKKSNPDQSSFKKNNIPMINEEQLTTHELAVEYTYGMVMHGDYQKWVNARSSGFLTTISITMEVSQLEGFVHAVYQILEGMQNDGTLNPDFSRIKQNSPKERRVSFWPSLLFTTRPTNHE